MIFTLTFVDFRTGEKFSHGRFGTYAAAAIVRHAIEMANRNFNGTIRQIIK
jgi:hypothetical protein